MVSDRQLLESINNMKIWSLSIFLLFNTLCVVGQHHHFLIYEREINLIKEEANRDSSEITINRFIPDTLNLINCSSCRIDSTYSFIGVLDAKKKRIRYERSGRYGTYPRKVKLKKIENGLTIKDQKKTFKCEFANAEHFSPRGDTSYSWFLIPFHEPIQNLNSLFKGSFIRLLPDYESNKDSIVGEPSPPILIESVPQIFVTIEFKEFIMTRRNINLEDNNLKDINKIINLDAARESIITKTEQGILRLYDTYIWDNYQTYTDYIPNWEKPLHHLSEMQGSWELEKLSASPDSILDNVALNYSLVVDKEYNYIFNKTIVSDSSYKSTYSGKIRFSPSKEILILKDNEHSYQDKYWYIEAINDESFQVIIERNHFDIFYPDYQIRATFKRIERL